MAVMKTTRINNHMETRLEHNQIYIFFALATSTINFTFPVKKKGFKSTFTSTKQRSYVLCIYNFQMKLHILKLYQAKVFEIVKIIIISQSFVSIKHSVYTQDINYISLTSISILILILPQRDPTLGA